MKFLFLLLFLFAQHLKAQNLVPNNSFESHDLIMLEDPNYNQMKYCKQWKIAGNTTPDWYSTDRNFLGTANGQTIQPASGNCYAGITPFEGFEVRLQDGIFNVDLTHGEFYQLSFWFCPRQSTTRLFARLSTERISDSDLIGPHKKNNQDYTGPNVNNIPKDRFTFEIDINTDPNVAGHFTPGIWAEFKSDPIYVVGGELKWLSIVGDDEGDAGSGQISVSSETVYIDEVSLNKIDLCSLPCFSNINNGEAQIMSVSSSVYQGGTNRLVVTVKNAIVFDIFAMNPYITGDDNIVYHYTAIEPKGLQNTMEPSIFRFEWDGTCYNYNSRLERGTQREYQGDEQVVLKISAFGCPGGKIERVGDLVNYFSWPLDFEPYTPVLMPNFTDLNFSHCCRQCRYLSNINTDEIRTYRASRGIYIGDNANIFDPGNIIFGATSNIDLYAGEEIIISNEFETTIGSEVVGEITACPYQQTSFWQRLGEEEKDSIKKDNDVIFSVYPNPANEFLNISLGRNEIDINRVLIFDIAGRLVLTPQLNKAKDSYSISLAGIPSGMYSCSILLDGNIINKSFVKL